jgi:curli biogenesis system outer membrane secretion channel CsgG
MSKALYNILSVAALGVIFILPTIAPLCHAQIVDVNLETEGTGPSIKAAVMDAITLAVSQVNGMEIATQTSHGLKEISVQFKNETSYFASDSFRQQVETATRGAVKNFRVLQAQQDPSRENLWVANVSSTISKYQVSDQIKRLRMAVAPFRIAASNSDIKSASKFESVFGQELVGYLTQTRKFAILDRSHFKEQSAELELIKGEGFSIAEIARIGNRVGTDYLIVGTINDFKETRWTQRMRTTGKEFNQQRLDLQLAYRIVDVATGQVKVADTYRFADESQGSGADHIAIARKAADSIGEKILNAIYPIVIASVRGSTVYLSQGGNSLKPGQRMEVIKLGVPVIDPYTKEALGREESRVGEIEVTDVQAKLSQAVLIKSAVDFASDFAPGDYIVRPSVAAKIEKVQAVAPASQTVKPASQPTKPTTKSAKISENEW